MRDLICEGDRLIAIHWPNGTGSFTAGRNGCVSIGVRNMPGPMGHFLVANVMLEEGPDVIAPLHMLESFSVLNP
jgi:hypothetical protein